MRRYVGHDRGPVYVEPDRPQSIPLGYIPQVEHTYAYYDANYAIMNEHQLMFGECTDRAKVQLEPEPVKRIFYSEELSRVAAERCTTAREAVALIGQLIDTYGYYGTGETLPIADPEEGWVIEMAPSLEGTGGVVAKKVPEGEVFVAANEFRIREIDPEDPETLCSKDLHDIAQKHGWWDPADGKLDWLATVSQGEYNHPYIARIRPIRWWMPGGILPGTWWPGTMMTISTLRAKWPRKSVIPKNGMKSRSGRMVPQHTKDLNLRNKVLDDEHRADEHLFCGQTP